MKSFVALIILSLVNPVMAHKLSGEWSSDAVVYSDTKDQLCIVGDDLTSVHLNLVISKDEVAAKYRPTCFNSFGDQLVMRFGFDTILKRQGQDLIDPQTGWNMGSLSEDSLVIKTDDFKIQLNSENDKIQFTDTGFYMRPDLKAELTAYEEPAKPSSLEEILDMPYYQARRFIQLKAERDITIGQNFGRLQNGQVVGKGELDWNEFNRVRPICYLRPDRGYTGPGPEKHIDLKTGEVLSFTGLHNRRDNMDFKLSSTGQVGVFDCNREDHGYQVKILSLREVQKVLKGAFVIELLH